MLFLKKFFQLLLFLSVFIIFGTLVSAHGRSMLGIQETFIHGLRVEPIGQEEVEYEEGVCVIRANRWTHLRLFGHGFSNYTIIRFVKEKGSFGSDCDDLTSTKPFTLDPEEIRIDSVLAKVILPHLDSSNGDEAYYVCLRQSNLDTPWIHQGTSRLLMIKTYIPLLPLWSMIVGIVVLLLLAAVFSGLNLGLMALDHTELKIIAATGSVKEKRYAKLIQPLRNRGNYLLCTLLLGNVMVNSTLTILLDQISSGLVAVVGATLSIVILGEIVPQAICSRHGLAIGAKTVWITKFFMLLTFPIAYPVSVILDKALGAEIGNVYNSERLKELLKITHGYNDLQNDEENIISGALELKTKMVVDVMTKLENVFMLPIEAILDFNTISEIMSQGYSRIPVYEKSRSHVLYILNTKDLAFVDPDDKMPLKVICEFRNYPLMFVSKNTKLDVVFRSFQKGSLGHMALVKSKDIDSAEEEMADIIGVITLEDIIEELIQADIKDEMDICRVNTSRRKSKSLLSIVSSPEALRWKTDGITISSQLALAAYQYLSTSIPEFDNDKISRTILQTLLNQDLYFEINVKSQSSIDSGSIIYEKGKAADFFVLILEGRVKSEMGNEKLVFESGPFTFYGIQSLMEVENNDENKLESGEQHGLKYPNTLENFIYSTFIPDYTVRAISDVTFLRIPRSLYIDARKATILERSDLPRSDSGINSVDEEFEKDGINPNALKSIMRRASCTQQALFNMKLKESIRRRAASPFQTGLTPTRRFSNVDSRTPTPTPMEDEEKNEDDGKNNQNNDILIKNTENQNIDDGSHL